VYYSRKVVIFIWMLRLTESFFCVGTSMNRLTVNKTSLNDLFTNHLSQFSSQSNKRKIISAKDMPIFKIVVTKMASENLK